MHYPLRTRIFVKMKRIVFILCAVAVVLLLVSSCHKKIWDMLNDHEARISRLETLCNQFNTNIASLQALVNAINARDYIKDVTPITENGITIGYTITFNGSNPITIYNGKNGEDGHTPIIGLKAEDGVWYWTLDGEWILDADGNKVRADGLTPQLKIEDDYWWVSYDNGTTWSRLGVAGSGAGGDSMFQEIRQDNDYVYFILANGEEIRVAKSHGLTWVYV